MEDGLLEDKEMFMSVKDFQERMVVLPDFGRKKKGAGGMHQDVEAQQPDGPKEEVADEEGGEEEGDVDAEEGDEEEVEEEGGDEEGGEEEDDARFINRECYEFNSKLDAGQDDKHCRHCKKYLTLHCPHIKDFMDDVEDYEPD